MRLFLLILLLSTSPLQAAASNCLGPATAKHFAIYLHGFESPGRFSTEETRNRDILRKLAQEANLRIALPQGPLCPNKKHCWPAKDETEILDSYQKLRKAAETCIPPGKDFSLIGFSNGGYFAFKLYKVHQDKSLKQIMAFGSAGEWDEKVDKPNPLSSFRLAIGKSDITLPKAKGLSEVLEGRLPGFQFETFPGGHRMDGPVLTKWMHAVHDSL